MPRLPYRPCGAPGCMTLARSKYCDVHMRGREAGGRVKQDYRKWYARKDYRTARDVFMIQHPTCAVHGCAKPSSDLDHIKPHKGNWSVFWDQSNWQALCAGCHSRKTAKEGGFGVERHSPRSKKFENEDQPNRCNPKL